MKKFFAVILACLTLLCTAVTSNAVDGSVLDRYIYSANKSSRAIGLYQDNRRAITLTPTPLKSLSTTTTKRLSFFQRKRSI